MPAINSRSLGQLEKGYSRPIKVRLKPCQGDHLASNGHFLGMVMSFKPCMLIRYLRMPLLQVAMWATESINSHDRKNEPDQGY